MISNIKIITRCIHFLCIPKPFLACTYTCRFVYWKMIHYFICFYSGFFFKYFGIVRIEWGICRVCPKTKCRYLRQVQSGLHQSTSSLYSSTRRLFLPWWWRYKRLDDADYFLDPTRFDANYFFKAHLIWLVSKVAILLAALNKKITIISI